jgi:hypothetical protein
MIDVKYPRVVNAAFTALATKFFDKLKFAFPVAASLVNFIPFAVPICLLTRWVTKPSGSWLSALNTLAVIRPPVSKVTFTGAELAAPRCSAERTVKLDAAVFADSRRVCFCPAFRSGQTGVPGLLSFLRCVLAIARTELAIAVAGVERLLAVLACFNHALSISCWPTYCKIAVKRCQAELERFPLFEQPKARQTELFRERQS